MPEFIPAFQELIHLFLVLCKDVCRLNPVKTIYQLFCHRRCKQVDRHCTSGLAAQLTKQPFRVIIENETYVFTPLKAN